MTFFFNLSKHVLQVNTVPFALRPINYIVLKFGNNFEANIQILISRPYDPKLTKKQ